MIKYLYILLFLSLFISCKNFAELKQSQEIVGIGIIYLDPKNPIKLYKNENGLNPFDSIYFTKNKILKKGSYTIGKNSISKFFNPYNVYLGDSNKEAEKNMNKGLIKFEPQIAFKVLEHKNNMYKILLNDVTKEYCFINMKERINLIDAAYLIEQNFDPNFVPDSVNNWFIYESWTQHMRNSIILNTDLKFFSKPNKGVEIEMKNNHFVVDTLIDDWAKCYIDDNKVAWTKWKENNFILFNYNRFIYF